MERKQIARKLSHVLGKLSNRAYYWRMAFLRKSFVYDQLKLKRAISTDKPLTKEEKDVADTFWKGVPIDKNWLQFYNWVERGRGQEPFDPRYIPLDMEYCCIDDWFNDTKSSILMDDKNFYDLYFPDIRQPDTVVRIINGHLMDGDFAVIDIDEAIQRCYSVGSIIAKPAVLACAGSGIVFWTVSDGENKLREILYHRGSYIIQKIVKQHSDIAKLHESSVNSIRVVTCFMDGEMKVLSSVIRMGANGSNVDNATLGGCFCGIEDDGRLKKYGYTKNGVAMETHPQGARFSDCVIPNYQRCKDLVCRMAYRFIRTSKLISWDLAIDEDGEPILIEVNLCYGGIDIHQIANGPIFGDNTKHIVEEVFKRKRYRLANRILK